VTARGARCSFLFIGWPRCPQANNLAEKNPDKLKELQAAFDVEAKKYHVYPLDSSFASRADPTIRPSLTRGRQEFIYYPGMIRIPEGSAPDFKNKSWAIAAEATFSPKNTVNGSNSTDTPLSDKE
jgi:hypothetical protein